MKSFYEQRPFNIAGARFWLEMAGCTVVETKFEFLYVVTSPDGSWSNDNRAMVIQRAQYIWDTFNGVQQ